MRFTDILDEHGVKWWGPLQHHHVTDHFVGFDCPYCSPGTGRVRMGCHTEKGYVVCWACGPQNRVEVLSLLTGLSKAKAYELLGGVEYDKFLPTRRPGKYEAPEGLRELMRQHRDYLRGRGLVPKDVVRLWRAQCFDQTAPRGLSWGIFIPVFYRGEAVSWTTRAISDDVSPRYMSAPSQSERWPAKSLLYGEDYCGSSVMVVEGPLDVWKIGPGATCTLGVSYSRAQLERIARYPRRVIVFDSTPDGRKKAREVCDQLAPFDGETLDVVLDAKDPGDASEKELRQLRRLL